MRMPFQVYSIVVIVPSVLPSSAVFILKPLRNSFGNFVVNVLRLPIYRKAFVCRFKIAKLSTRIRPLFPDTRTLEYWKVQILHGVQEVSFQCPGLRTKLLTAFRTCSMIQLLIDNG